MYIYIYIYIYIHNYVTNHAKAHQQNNYDVITVTKLRKMMVKVSNNKFICRIILRDTTICIIYI